MQLLLNLCILVFEVSTFCRLKGLEVKLPYDPVCPSVSRLVGWYVCRNFRKGHKVSLHAPIGALVILLIHPDK